MRYGSDGDLLNASKGLRCVAPRNDCGLYMRPLCPNVCALVWTSFSNLKDSKAREPCFQESCAQWCSQILPLHSTWIKRINVFALAHWRECVGLSMCVLPS